MRELDQLVLENFKKQNNINNAVESILKHILDEIEDIKECIEKVEKEMK